MSDLISRSALYDKLIYDTTKTATVTGGEYIATWRIADAIVDAPTIDAVPVVHGRWEIKWNAEFVDPFGETEEIPSAVCPFCGHEEFYVAYDDDWAKPHNYCSNCGAKLDGEADG